jgi:ABC-type multidrug transport system permease subunit
MSTTAISAAFLSPLTHTLDLVKLGTGGSSYFGIVSNIGVLSAWLIVFLYVGQMFHKTIMKRE